MIILRILSFSILLLISIPLMGRHIVGGTITYEYLDEEDGSPRLSVCIRLFRDRYAQQASNFDPSILVQLLGRI